MSKYLIMKRNMGQADRLIRTIIALAVIALYFTGVIKGTAAIILLIIAAIFFMTSLFSVCPLYSLFGINSCFSKGEKID